MPLIQAINKIFFPKKELRFKKYVEWNCYLRHLDKEDRDNVVSICDRCLNFIEDNNMPIAVVSVGSVLNQKDDKDYNDVDLLLLPVNKEDCGRFEELAAGFIKNQPEARMKKFRIRNTCKLKTRYRRPGKKWRTKVLTLPDEEEYCGFPCVDFGRYWSLDFPRGKTVQIFIRAGLFRQTLTEMIITETGRKFSYKII